MKVLNLGCGTKTSNKPLVINIDWSIYFTLKKSRILSTITPLIIKGERLDRFNSLPKNIMIHDLTNGIPFDSDSVDAVYHSHMLEHLDRGVAEKFLLEVKRVLKAGGIHRLVVPDFEKACKAYISHIAVCETNADECHNHDAHIAALIEQSVRKESFGTNKQKPLRRLIENAILGDARKRGETHQWMYDGISLKALLVSLGYKEVLIQDYNKSLIQNWSEYGLDTDENGNQYKPESLYVEAVK